MPHHTRPPARSATGRRILGVQPLKAVFALEYMLQGLANPFQGITYQPFIRHFRVDYGLSEAATQALFAKSYLAWSFKPVIGFLIDAYGRTRSILILLLVIAVFGYILTPLIDRGPTLFFASMFLLSIVLAATDVAVDRATVVAGEEESRSTGRSKSTTVGLNQAICWVSIYGTGVLAAVLGGYLSEHVPFSRLMIGLASVPLLVLGAVILLPRDRAVPIPVTRSIQGFWEGLNTGPILGVMLFYFIFHFQPAMGPLWNNHLIETLGFTQTQIGFADGCSYVGLFLGVLLFAWKGVRWQDLLGLRKIFRFYIVLSVAFNLSQYLLVEPRFSAVTGAMHRLIPFMDDGTVRLVYLSSYNLLIAIGIALVRMSTFSLVGAVIPAAAAGSLFAGFMSVSNLAYSFSYSSGAWLYDHGMDFRLLRGIQSALFGLPGSPGSEMSIQMLILLGSLAYFLSFAAVHLLPDRRQTLATEVSEETFEGPGRWRILGGRALRAVNISAIAAGTAAFFVSLLAWGLDPVSALMSSFFGTAILRQAALDLLLRRARA